MSAEIKFELDLNSIDINKAGELFDEVNKPGVARSPEDIKKASQDALTAAIMMASFCISSSVNYVLAKSEGTALDREAVTAGMIAAYQAVVVETLTMFAVSKGSFNDDRYWLYVSDVEEGRLYFSLPQLAVKSMRSTLSRALCDNMAKLIAIGKMTPLLAFATQSGGKVLDDRAIYCFPNGNYVASFDSIYLANHAADIDWLMNLMSLPATKIAQKNGKFKIDESKSVFFMKESPEILVPKKQSSARRAVESRVVEELAKEEAEKAAEEAKKKESQGDVTKGKGRKLTVAE